jgi:hypothetical protein
MHSYKVGVVLVPTERPSHIIITWVYLNMGVRNMHVPEPNAVFQEGRLEVDWWLV